MSTAIDKQHSRECYIENYYHKRTSESWWCICKINDPWREYNSYPTYKELEQAIQRVRELIAQYESDSVKVSAKPIERAIFKVVAQELNKALEGENNE